MKKKLLLATVIAIAAPALWLGSARNSSSQDNALGLGQKLAGGWLANFTLPNESGEILFNLTADGGMIMNGTLRPWDWEAGEAGGWFGTRNNTTAHGSWVRIGPNQIRLTVLMFVQDWNGKTVFYEKGWGDFTLNKAGTSLEGALWVQLIWAGTDPLDPDPDKILVTMPAATTARPIR